MPDLILSNVFFFIASIAVVLFTAVLIAALVYVIGVMRDIRHITNFARRQHDLIQKEVSNFFGKLIEIVEKFLVRRKKVKTTKQ